MKVRWENGSLRLRITPSELDALTRGEEIGQSLTFAGGLAWAVTVRPGGDQTALTADGPTALLRLSESDRDALASPEAEGVYFSHDAPSRLRFCIEKDFPCGHKGQGQGAETFGRPPAR